MKSFVKITRGILIAIIIMAVVVPTTAYVMLSTQWANSRLKQASEEALHRFLGVEVTISDIEFHPFNSIIVKDINIMGDDNLSALKIHSVSARVELADFLFRHTMIIDYAVIDGLDAKIYKSTHDSPLNIASIIDKFSQPKAQTEPKPFEFQVNNVELLNSTLSYDVKSEPVDTGYFDVNHICLYDLDAVIHAPLISTEAYGVRLRKLSFKERSGFEVDNISTDLSISPQQVGLTNLEISLPNTKLAFGDIAASIDGIKTIGEIGTRFPVHLTLNDDSHIFLPDLKYFEPKLGALELDLNAAFDIEGIADSLTIRYLDISEPSRFINLEAHGCLINLPKGKEAQFNDFELNVSTNSQALREAMRLYAPHLPSIAWRAIANAGNISLDGKIDGSLKEAFFDMAMDAKFGMFNINGTAGIDEKIIKYNITSEITDLQLGTLIENYDIGALSLDATSKGLLVNNNFKGDIDAKISHFDFKGYTYSDINLQASVTDTLQHIIANSDDKNLDLTLDFKYKNQKNNFKQAELLCDIAAFDPDALNLWDRFPGHSLSSKISMQAQGYSADALQGSLCINNLLYLNDEGTGLRMRQMCIDADNLSLGINSIYISSDYINGNVIGQIKPTYLVTEIKEILLDIFPNIMDNVDSHFPEETIDNANNFSYDFTIGNAVELSHFFSLPLIISDPIDISGELSSERKLATLGIDAPWLLQGNKMIEGTTLSAVLDGVTAECNIYITSLMPTKKGPMDLVTLITSDNGKLLTTLDWEIIREIPINGKINFLTDVQRRQDQEGFVTTVQFDPGQINFGDEIWQIQPSKIEYFDKMVKVSNFELSTPTQNITINGVGSDMPDDLLKVELKDIKLLDIFETLDIDKALICGSATGTIYASEIFTPTPVIRSENFHVKDIGYNSCVLGDADISLGFDNEMQAFTFDADIVDAQGRNSSILGYIKPATEELDLQFDANHIKVGFMRPFMEAFCDDIKGYATGKAHLYGTFKYIDMTGDIQADSLQLKIGFTNTWYHANANIPLTPGMINLRDITIFDVDGDSATLNGYVKHTFFKAPVFNFSITNARNFLCYDVPKNTEYQWYGKIYGSGSAIVDGAPGWVKIGVDMTTAPKTTFTFELSDQLVAEEYSFINFRDVTPTVIVDSILDIRTESYAQRWSSMHNLEESEDKPSDYQLEFNVNITNDALMTLVMDPVGGDDIKAYGTGHLRMTYGSVDNALAMYGEYTLDQGTYNFTLQSLIFREFKIRRGSKITFTGDPYNANLDIEATFSVKNANLSDLDESFLNDKELQRTNVPVDAVLKVSGDMLQPDISFDLDFPSLNQDTYRKVRSIVSTEDMMNRQIIYLLALNRFYTPDYMSATKGNNLFSVASSTISSQLSSVLGKLSDNWSIAPNLRSDRGDFSDLEVDLSLSSTLLNNRLLFNGNFGYRDKSLNTNQFVGDFDVEYLLNRKGTLRLKAYNRYNDQNYYLRSAQTTQGLGIVIKHDFDNVLDFLRKRKPQQPTDTLKSE